MASLARGDVFNEGTAFPQLSRLSRLGLTPSFTWGSFMTAPEI